VRPEIEVWKRQTTRCTDCGGKRVVYTGEAVAEGRTLAVFWAFLYDHPGNPEVFIDATFGTWGIEGYTADHVTFGARTGKVEGQSTVASSLVAGAELGPDDPRYGVKLSRDQAMAHPGLALFWEVNDAVLELDEVAKLLAGQPLRGRFLRRR
jgi:hypothetical protein